MTNTRRTLFASALALALAAGFPSVSLSAYEQGPGGGPGMMGQGPRGPMGPGRGMRGMRGGPGGPGQRGPGGPMREALAGLGRLNLTDAQRQQVRGIMQQHQQEFQAIGARLRSAMEAVRVAGEAETLDESALRARVAERAAVEADAAVLRARVRGEVWALLTPEQQQQARAERQQREQRQQERQQRMQQWRQQRQPPGAQGRPRR